MQETDETQESFAISDDTGFEDRFAQYYIHDVESQVEETIFEKHSLLLFKQNVALKTQLFDECKYMIDQINSLKEEVVLRRKNETELVKMNKLYKKTIANLLKQLKAERSNTMVCNAIKRQENPEVEELRAELIHKDETIQQLETIINKQSREIRELASESGKPRVRSPLPSNKERIEEALLVRSQSPVDRHVMKAMAGDIWLDEGFSKEDKNPRLKIETQQANYKNDIIHNQADRARSRASYDGKVPSLEEYMSKLPSHLQSFAKKLHEDGSSQSQPSFPAIEAQDSPYPSGVNTNRSGGSEASFEEIQRLNDFYLNERENQNNKEGK